MLSVELATMIANCEPGDYIWMVFWLPQNDRVLWYLIIKWNEIVLVTPNKKGDIEDVDDDDDNGIYE